MPRATLTIGHNLDGRVRVTRYVGEGGIGSIYEGELDNAPVTVLAAPGEFIKDPGAFAVFQREAQAASALGQEHIAQVRASGRAADGTIILVTELLGGQTLAQRRRLPPGRAAHIAAQIAAAVAPAHRQGLVHRDLDPDLVFLVQHGSDPDWVKVVGFGWSRVLGDDPAVRARAQALGYPLPWWTAPELTQRRPGDHRTDLYAIGALLYAVATGRPPYDGADVNALYRAIAGGRYPPARSVDPQIPPPLEQAMSYALVSDPAQRYPSAEHFIQTLAPLAQPASAAALAALETLRPGVEMEGVAAQMDELEARPQSKALPLAVAGAIAVGVFGVLLLVRSGSTPGPSKPTVGGGDTPVAAAGPDAASTAAAPSAPDGGPKVASAAPDAAATAEAPKMTTLKFDVKPPDARVAVNGKPVTGATTQVQTGDYKVKVEIRAPGYLPHEEEVGAAKDVTLTVELKKEVAATKPPADKPTQPKNPPPHKPPVHKPKIDL